MTAKVLQGDVFALLPTLTPGSVDAVCTSPPYWQLRSYLPKGHPLKPLELGSEPTPAEYVANQVRVFRLVREAMAEHAVAFLNVGDTYSHDSRGGKTGGKHFNYHGNTAMGNGRSEKLVPVPAGNLCLIPQRLAIALQDDGWLVRSVICWHKPSCMPSSVSGWAWKRCRVKVKGHDYRKRPDPNCKPQGAVNGKDFANTAEWSDCPGCKKCAPHGGYVLRRGKWRPTSSWEPVLMLAKSPGYFCDGESVKTPAAAATVSRDRYGYAHAFKGQFAGSPVDERHQDGKELDPTDPSSAGANLRDVWTIASEPLRAQHFAAFPTELVHRCLRAGTSARGYCPHCGAPWCRVMDKQSGDTEASKRPKKTGGMDSGTSTLSLSGNGSKEWAERGSSSRTLDWRPSCPCPDHDPRPGLVLDPFAGSGRTGVEAGRLGLDFVGCDLNPEYVDMATRILRDESPLFAGFTEADHVREPA